MLSTPSLDYFFIFYAHFFLSSLLAWLLISSMALSLIFRGSLAVLLLAKGPSHLGSQSINYESTVSMLQGINGQFVTSAGCDLRLLKKKQLEILCMSFGRGFWCVGGHRWFVTPLLGGHSSNSSAYMQCSGGVVFAFEHSRPRQPLEQKQPCSQTVTWQNRILPLWN